MKKILLPLMAVAALLTACDEERYDAPQFQKGVTFTVPDFVDEAGTRVAVTIDNSGANFTWTEGDTLGVFPSNGYQTAFPISGGAGTNTAVFDGADWALRPNASYAAYYPFVYEIKDKTAISVSYLGQTQDGNGTTAHLGDYDYLAAKYATVSSSGDVNFTLNHLGCLVRFQLTMPEADTYTTMTLSCEGANLTTASQFDLSSATPSLSALASASSLYLGLKNIATIAPNQVLTLYMMLPPMDLAEMQLSVHVSGNNGYCASFTGLNFKAGCIYNFSKAVSSTHNYVDLGLSSGTLWATTNVGANRPEDFGDYFAWGEESPKLDYEWSTYKHGTHSTRLTKYNPFGANGIVDNKAILDIEDDAAACNWGGAWHTPTYEQMDELMRECTWTWTRVNYVNGYNVVGPNGNCIFLPAGGFKINQSTTSSTSGEYLTNTLRPNSIEPYTLSFVSYNIGWGYYRYQGCSVRPVFTPTVYVETLNILGDKTMNIGESQQLSVEFSPLNATDASVSWHSSDETVATVSTDGFVTAVAAGSVTITATANDGSGVSAEYEITVAAPANTHNGHEYVDLGITDDNGNPIYWATCNVGANSPEDYGGYYAWGETKAYEEEDQNNANNYSYSGSYVKTYYDWNTYKLCNGSLSTITKYCTNSKYGIVDNKIILEASDDAATVNWGGAWRMPTKEEISKLRKNCVWIWASSYKDSGVPGYVIYKNQAAANNLSNNHIFLPAAGYRDGDGNVRSKVQGLYWTSTSGGESFSNCCDFISTNIYGYYTSPHRCLGLTIRPVFQL